MKNWSARAWLTPGLPLRSVSAPRQAIMSLMTVFTVSSSAESGGMIPSPLKTVCAKIFVVSVVSSMVMAGASFLPRLARICLAEESNCFPSGVASLMALNGSDGEDVSRSSRFFRQLPAHRVAAMMSGARIRPSWSVSIKSSVLVPNSIPRVGHASATQSFWSS